MNPYNKSIFVKYKYPPLPWKYKDLKPTEICFFILPLRNRTTLKRDFSPKIENDTRKKN